MRKYSLYYLASSEDNTAFYIGVTSTPLSKRLKGHKEDSRNPHKKARIKQILDAGHTILILPIVEDMSNKEIASLEISAISLFKTLGFNLTNISIGGNLHCEDTLSKMREKKKAQGFPAHVTELARAAAIGRPRPPEVREKIRLGHLGKSKGPQTPEHIESRAKHRRGVKQKQSTIDKRVATRRANDNYVVSDESRRKMSEAHLGQKPTPESIAKRVATVTGQKRTEEQKRRIAEGIRAGKRYKKPLDVAA